MRIQYKIFFIFLMITLFVLAAVASSYYLFFQNALKKEVLKNLEAQGNVQHHMLDDFIVYNEEKLGLISSRTQMRISLRNHQEKKDERSLNMIKRIVTDAVRQAHDIEDIVILDRGGAVVCSISGEYEGRSFSKEPSFLNGKSRKFVSLVQPEDEGSVPKIFFSAPLVLEKEFIGVIVMQVGFDHINRILRDYAGLGRTGEVLLANETKRGNALIFSPLRFAESPMLLEKGSVFCTPMKNALAKREMVFDDVLDYRGERVFALTRYLDALGIGILVKIDREEVLEVYDDLQRVMFHAALAMIVVVLVSSILLSRLISKRIIDITKGAVRISRGNLEYRLKVSGRDELGELASALNRMADKLIEKSVGLKRANDHLKKMAMVDGLTGVANRRQFDTHIKNAWRRCMRMQIPLSVIMIDIDLFKAVNDLLGHQRGDEYLKKIASVINKTVKRASDLAARYGGEEFALVLEDTPLDEAVALAEKIRLRVLECGLEHPSSTIAPSVSVSLGVASIVPRQHEEVSLLIEAADRALYRAKAEGRNRVVRESEA